MDNDMFRLTGAPDIINADISIELCSAIDTCNKRSARGFSSWKWDENLQIVIVDLPNIPLNRSYYYTMSEGETILTAKALTSNFPCFS